MRISYLNSLAPGRPGCHFKTAIFNLVLLIGFFRSSNDNAPRWMSWDLMDGKSTMVQVMAWNRQTTSHYLSQCWPSSISPYGVTRPQWVKGNKQNIPRIMHMVFILSCFVDVATDGATDSQSYPYPSGLLHWHWGNPRIAPVPVKQPWNIWGKYIT